MAVTTVTRSSWTDDSGGGIDGTIVKNSELAKIYDNIDLLFSGTGAYATVEMGGNFTVDKVLKGKISYGAATTLTLASDACTPTQNLHQIDTQGAAATDDLSTLTIAGDIASGHLLRLFAANVARVVTVKTGVGNIVLRGGDCPLYAATAFLDLQLVGTTWYEVGRSEATVVLDRSTTEQDVLNTTTPTAVYSFAVPAGVLQKARSLRLTLIGGYTNNSGSSRTVAVAVAFGGTTIAAGTAFSFGSNANRHPFRMQIDIAGNGATNSQRANGVLFWGSAGWSAETDWTIPDATYEAMNTALAVDTTAAATLSVTISHSNPDTSFKRYFAILEVL